MGIQAFHLYRRRCLDDSEGIRGRGREEKNAEQRDGEIVLKYAPF